MKLVAGTTATTATTASTGEPPGRSGGAGSGCGEHGKLDCSLLAGALGAANLLLLVDHDLLKALIAAITHVFINRHIELSPDSAFYRPRREGLL
jgi:hypothetical protein